MTAAEPAPAYRRTPAEAQRVADFNARRCSTPRAGSITTQGTAENGAFQIALEHPDQEVGSVALMESFGVKEGVLANHLLFQLINIARNNSGAPPDQDAINAAIAAVHGIAPQDEAEAMLASQMVGVHFLTMQLLQRAVTADAPHKVEQNTNMATKMLRTFAAQMETLKRYRSKGESRVVVQHQHVHVQAGQAAVQVNGAAPGVEGAGSNLKIEEQAHAQLFEGEGGPSLFGEDPERCPVPRAGCEG